MILIDGAKVYADVLGVMLGNHLLYGLKEPRLEIDRQILRAIRNVEPVDAAKVVRCKDCKYYTGKWCTKYSTKQFDPNDICKDDNDFCSMAERKDNG